MRCERARLSSEPAPPDLALETAQPGDADAILDLYSTCGFGPRSRERMQAVLSDGRHAHGVARAEGRVVAFVELETHWPRRVWVAFVGVAPQLRARGRLGATSWALGASSGRRRISLLMLLVMAAACGGRPFTATGWCDCSKSPPAYPNSSAVRRREQPPRTARSTAEELVLAPAPVES
jgi:hypothetical protein